MVAKLLGECKRRGEEIRVWRDISEKKGWTVARGRGENVKERELNGETALGGEALFDANTGVKREGLRRQPTWILQG